MERINLYEFYELGRNLRVLNELSGDMAVKDAFRPLFVGGNWLERMLSADVISQKLSRHAAEHLSESIAKLTDKYYEGPGDSGQPPRTKIPRWEITTITRAYENFEHVLAAELRESSTYFVPNLGIYDTAGLVETADTQIPEKLRAHMNEIATNDFRGAGRCLAFDLPTASGFHAARAVEGVLGDYHGVFVGPSAETSDKTMNEYIQELEGLAKTDRRPLPDEKTLRTLRGIKDFDRNPLMHPRVELNSDDAMALFNLATSAIISMTMEMDEIGARAGQGSLELVSGIDDNGEQDEQKRETGPAV